MKRIYLDNNATTQVRPEVLEAMLPFFCERFGNPSSVHWAGRDTRGAVEGAREQVARLIGASTAEIVFTSCGSEGNNFAIKGTVEALRHKGNHIITSAVEHPAVLEVCDYFEKQGCEVTRLPVDQFGYLTAAQVEAAIRPTTVLISLMWANNETGTIFPIDEIGAVARRHGVRFHCDAVQAVGKVPVNVETAGVDLLTIAAHKFGGPKGVGAIFVRRGTKLVPFMHGGHQERHRRAGTHNVPGIVGLGVACELVSQELLPKGERLRVLRDKLEQGIVATVPEVKVNGHTTERLPNTLNISFAYIEGESLLLNLDMKGIAASSGSACTSGSLEPSHVLGAMGVPVELAHSSTRFSLGPDTVEADIDYLIEILPPIVQRLREMSPLYPGAAVMNASCTGNCCPAE